MTLFDKPFSDITEDDIKFLQSQEILESKTIEYKNKLPEDTSSNKKEFLYDITAFANSSGGIIFYGIDENEGKPIAINGLENIDVDKEILRLEDIIKFGISPRISNLTIRSLELSNSNNLILIQIPNSWSSPHMVSYNHSGKFYARNSAGKYQMDAHEIKQAFLLTETINDKIRSFRVNRFNAILDGNTPLRLDNNPIIILHTIPLVSFKSLINIDITWIANNFIHLRPMGGRPSGSKFNLDGVYTYLNLDSPDRNAYAQIYRSGIIETSSNLLTKKMQNGSKRIMSIFFEQEVLSSLGNFLQLYEKIGIEPPIFVFLSMVYICDYSMGVDSNISFMWRDRYETPINQDNILFPEIMIDSVSTEDLPRKIKSLFDMVWNSTGWPYSMNYDESGNWKVGNQGI